MLDLGWRIQVARFGRRDRQVSRGKAPLESAMSVLPALERRMSETPGSTRYDAAPVTSDAQSRFVSENMRRVFLLIYRIVGNVADAQDLTQEAFIKALQRQDQLKDLEKAAHWLFATARHEGKRAFESVEEALAALK